jgi:putative Holliday junction resolvase
MKILGVDYGDKRMGIAISDEIGLLAHPLTTIADRNLNMLLDVIKENQIEAVVVGKPLNMNGTYSSKTREVLNFINELKKIVNIPVHEWDERLSTKEAERLLIGFDLSRKKRKGILDKSSARIILQGYLDSIRIKQNV